MAVISSMSSDRVGVRMTARGLSAEAMRSATKWIAPAKVRSDFTTRARPALGRCGTSTTVAGVSRFSSNIVQAPREG